MKKKSSKSAEEPTDLDLARGKVKFLVANPPMKNDQRAERRHQVKRGNIGSLCIRNFGELWELMWTYGNFYFHKSHQWNQLDAFGMIWENPSWHYLPMTWPTSSRVITTLKPEILMTHIFPEKVPRGSQSSPKFPRIHEIRNACLQWAVEGWRLWVQSPVSVDEEATGSSNKNVSKV